MLNDQQTNLVQLLSQPHRITNPQAMMKACRDAAELIQKMDAELDALKAPKKAAPKRKAPKS
jgi:hypothetical protein